MARHVACHPMNNSSGKWSSMPRHKTRPASPVQTLQGHCDQSQKWRGTLRFLPQLGTRSSSIAPIPVAPREALPNFTVSLTSQRHPELLPEVTGHKWWEPRVSCRNRRKTSRVLLQSVLRPNAPTLTREQLHAPPRHSHGRPDFPGATGEAP